MAFPLVVRGTKLRRGKPLAAAAAAGTGRRPLRGSVAERVPVREKMCGKKRASGVLSMGEQEHMMPVLASTMVQIVDSMVAWVVSGAVEENARVVMRRIDVMQTLRWGGVSLTGGEVV